MKPEYEKCSIDDAQFFRIKETIFSYSDQTASKKGDYITLKTDSDHYVNFHKDDLEQFAVESLRKKKIIPNEFIATPEFIVTSYGDNHGMPFQRGYYALKPDPDQDVCIRSESKFKCIEIIEE